MDEFFDAKNTNSENDSDCESISELSSSESDISEIEDEINIDDLLGNYIFRNNIYTIYMITSDTLLKIDKHWSYNRGIDIKHYEKISDELQKMKKPFLIGSIKIVKDSMNNFRIIDGQHRIKAIREAKLNKPDFIITHLQVDVYPVADCNYNCEISTLFKLANSNKNVSESEIPNDIIIKAIDKLKTRHFPKKILDKKKGQRANHPNITTNELYECIKESNIIIEYKLDEKGLIDAIVNYNIKCCSSTFEEMFLKNNKKNKELFERAKRNKFFLGLKRGPNRCLMYDWIYEIKNDLYHN